MRKTFAIAALALAATVSADFITEANLKPAYDFVIAGGGLAGLVLAARLSEDSSTSVLVLEAGGNGDDVRDSIDVPVNAYFKSLLGTAYDWAYQTVAQPNLGGRQIGWARGKGLGGSTAVNGLYLVRPSALEFNAWMNLVTSMDGYQAWGWDSMFEAMKKSETFTAPSADVAAAGTILFDPASHGTSGPLHYSYPGYILPVVGSWTDALDWIGIPPSPDANGGAGWGGFIATSAINPANWTRSYSRSAYIDPLPPRSNLHILVNATVTRIIFDPTAGADGLKATGVEWSTGKGAAKRTVNANKEVLLNGGAVGSPHILMHSGVGPSDVLQAAGVTVALDLPGVGQHLQDHVSGQVVWSTSADTAASLHSANANNSTFLSFVNSAIAYANITDLLGDYAPQFKSELEANATDAAAATLVPSKDAGVIAGYKAINKVYTDTVLLSQAGQVELLFSLTGTSVGGDKSIAIQAALQHPFSQGRLFITTNEPFDYPSIDPQYLSHPADTLLIREGLKLARKLADTDALKPFMTQELSPGSNVTSDDDWDNWLKGQVGTEFHPSCTCAMLPLNMGGVVDANLLVHGLANVRITDSSIYPIEFAAHLQAPTYGVAEQAAQIIRAKYNGGTAPASALTSHTAPPTAPVSSSTGKPTNTSSTASRLTTSLPNTMLMGILTACMMTFAGAWMAM